MEDFHFHDAQYLWALWLIPGLLFMAWLTQDIARKRLTRFATTNALKRLLLGEKSARLFSLQRFCFFASLGFFLLALARPQGNPIFEEQNSVGLDIMIVLDVSRSMDAEDIYPSRLKKAKREINTMLDHLSGDRVGIVAFAGSAALMAPLTSDYEVIRSYLEAIDTSTIENQGTNIAEGLNVAVEAFQRGSEGGLSPEDKSNLILLLSDGEVHEGSSFDAVEKAKNLGISIYTIAFGTEKGVPIPIRDPQGQLLSYKRDPRGENVITKVDPGALKEIATHGAGVFYFSTLDEGEITDILARTANLKRSVNKEVKGKVYKEYFPYFLFPGILLFFLSLLSIRPAKVLAFSFLVFAPILLLASLFSPSYSLAGDLPPQSALWDKNRRLSEEALEQYKAGKFSDATEILKSLQVENPSSPVVAYDLGTSLLKDKKYEEGRNTLSEAAKAEGLPGLISRMNIAGSYAEEKKLADAQSEYSSIIHDLAHQEHLNQGEQALLEQAQKNLELLSPQEQKQQQQKDQQEQQQNQQKQKEQDQQKQKQKQDQAKQNPELQDQNKEQKGQEDKDYDMRHKPFEDRQDMSEQDAKRMLQALKQQENSVQKKFLRKLGNDSNLRKHESTQDW